MLISERHEYLKKSWFFDANYLSDSLAIPKKSFFEFPIPIPIPIPIPSKFSEKRMTNSPIPILSGLRGTTIQRFLFGVTSAVTKKCLSIRTARYIFMSVKNMQSSQHYIIYSPPIGCSDPLYSPPKRCEPHQPKTGCVCWVFDKPPLIADASTTICTGFISRAAPLCPNLDCNLCPTLTAHSDPLPFSELAETRSRHIRKLRLYIYVG